MSIKKKIELRLQTIEWYIVNCEKEMEQSKKNMQDCLERNDVDIVCIMEGYLKQFKEAYEKRRVLMEEKRNLEFILKTEDEA